MNYQTTPSVRTEWTADRILDLLYQKRSALREMGVRQIGLFGSYVHNRQHPGSDIDLLFTMDAISFTKWMAVWNFLEDEFGVEVDLVPAQDLREELRDAVLPEVRYVENL